MSENVLKELISLYGIIIDHPAEDIKHSDKYNEYLVSILKATGVPITSVADGDDLLRQVQQQYWQQIFDPVLVVNEKDMPLTVQTRFPENDAHHYQWILTEETGAEHSDTFTPADLAEVSRHQISERSYYRRRLDLSLSLPCGYHQFKVRAADQTEDEPFASLQLIVTPEYCYIPPGIQGDGRVWGISAHLHAIRSRNNWGIGDFSDLQQILSWAAANGAGAVHTAPLHSLLFKSQQALNPYSPSCRSLLNELYLDINAIPDFTESEEAKNHINDAVFQARLASLRNRDRIDYDAVFQIKVELFKILWNHFFANHLNPETARGIAFRRFQRQGGETLRYSAVFAALVEEFSADGQGQQGWMDLPADFQNPFSKAVADFTRTHEYEIEFYQYLQWQADIQLAAIGRRSMELGLKIGIVGDFPFGSTFNGFESWYFGGLLLKDARVSLHPFADSVIDPAVGLPLLLPNKLREICYQPFIQGLRRAMSHTGALIIRSMTDYFQVPFSLTGLAEQAGMFIRFSFSDIIEILALESQRNRCLVIADHIHLLPEEQQKELLQKKIFTSKVLFQAKDGQENWLDPADYPANSVINSSAPFLVTMKGFWAGRDITVKTTEMIFRDDAEKEKSILSRASDRAHFLISLDHEKLLPEGYALDPTAVPEFDFPLIAAGQIFLARTPAKIFLVSLNDLLGMEEQADPPVLSSQPFWKMRFTIELDNIIANQEIESIFQALCRERGIGVIRPSAPSPDRRKRHGVQIPVAFYRLQMHKDFTFLQAAEIVPYLKKLGITHCYLSPFLMARPGSRHGYDIISHGQLNPEIGRREDFEKFVAVIEHHKMALLIDIVPNHMGIGSDNQWWMDVLENGEASLYADFFDINWQPQQTELAGRVLLPVLGDHYGKILESGGLSLHFHENTGNFTIRYYDHLFPVDPGTCAIIINHDLKRLSDRLGKEHNGYLELRNLISSFNNLPDRRETSNERIQTRHRDKEVNKRILARLCREVPEIKRFIEENVILFNGESDKPESFDLLHNLLEEQPYRLAYWRVAADEINYRRFFDINDLAGLRIEKNEVFRAAHELILDLIDTGKVDGLRIDHPDGLYDPCGYFYRLQAAVAGEFHDDVLPSCPITANRENIPLYVVVEKILADFEHLPETWPVYGTTGYDYANLLNGLLLNAAAEKQMTSLYNRFITTRFDFDDIVYNCKKKIIRTSMAGELNVLTSLLYRLAQRSRSSRDFTLNRLRDALTEIVACFPVYRTYITSPAIHKNDIQYIEWAIAKARTKQQLQDVSVFEFIQNVLLLKITDSKDNSAKRLDFVLKLQQYTGPVMAKGLEDTSFYIYNRLLSLNEVGGDPKRFGISVAAFHRTNLDRLHHWPHSMLNSSTHDSKRSEDVRARINVLTEMVKEWRERVFRWSKLNHHLKTRLDDMLVPTGNDEYAFYQTLVGAWPIGPQDVEGLHHFAERMKDTMLKTCRESKVHTSWINPNKPYESGLIRFVEGTLTSPDNQFLTDFLPFQQDVSWFGMLNSLSQVFLKLVSPGIPDIYQGNEIWRYCLVDPDNRRPVDYRKRQTMLFSMLDRINADGSGVDELQQELLANLSDGRAKMYTILRTLELRNSQPEVFEQGSYMPLEVAGSKAAHLCAFARKAGDRMIVAVAPRLYLILMQSKKDLPLGEKVWDNTEIKLPSDMTGRKLRNIFSGRTANDALVDNDSSVIPARRLLRSWPLALLKATD